MRSTERIGAARGITRDGNIRRRQRASRSLVSRDAPVARCIAAHIVMQRPQFASFCSVGDQLGPQAQVWGDSIPGGHRMATKKARDAAPDVAQPNSQRNRVALVEARRMTPGDTS